MCVILKAATQRGASGDRNPVLLTFTHFDLASVATRSPPETLRVAASTHSQLLEAATQRGALGDRNHFSPARRFVRLAFDALLSAKPTGRGFREVDSSRSGSIATHPADSI